MSLYGTATNHTKYKKTVAAKKCNSNELTKSQKELN